MKPIEIFRIGAHTPEIGAKELSEIATHYDKSKHEAPITKGHPKSNAPAYGWIEELFVRGDSLYALPAQMDKSFEEEVGKGAYKKISASFYLPGASSNPIPGKWSLRHVGFLGAQVPAVKGMKAAEFNDSADDYLTYDFNDSNQSNNGGNINMNDNETKNLGTALGAVLAALGLSSSKEPASQQSVDNSDGVKPAAASSQDTSDLDEREAKLKAREKALAEREAKEARANSAEYVEELIKAGKLLPAHKETVINLLESINAKDTVSFDEDGSTITKSKLDAVKGFLGALPKQVNYSEVTPPTDAKHKAPVNFKVPADYRVDEQQLAVHLEAVDYQEKHGGADKVDYTTAVRAVQIQ